MLTSKEFTTSSPDKKDDMQALHNKMLLLHRTWGMLITPAHCTNMQGNLTGA